MPDGHVFMFGLGHIVWFFPAISAVLLLLALRSRSRRWLSIAAAVAVAALFGMLYAMYPVHLMMRAI